MGTSPGGRTGRNANTPAVARATTGVLRCEAITELLPDMLVGLGGDVELASLAVVQGNAEGLLQEPAGLEAVDPGVALRLHGGLAGRRDGNFNQARHAVPSTIWSLMLPSWRACS